MGPLGAVAHNLKGTKMTEPTTWLWFVSGANDGSDGPREAVVAAHTEVEARMVNPSKRPEKLLVNRIGRADRHVMAGSRVLSLWSRK